MNARLTVPNGTPRNAAALLSFLALAACSADRAPTALAPAGEQPSLAVGQAQGPEFVPGELLVKFRAGASPAARGLALGRANGVAAERIQTNAMRRAGDDEGITVVRTPMGVAAAVQALRESPDVEYAEPNWIYTHGAVTTDTYYTNGSLWGMYGDGTSPANQFGSQAGEAWAAGNTGSASVYVGVIDEGIQVTHPDLNANVWTNPYDPADGVDNDGNGYIDDKHGWDFANNDATVYDGGTRGSQDSHGTHVAGTIGAENNGTGVVGVNWNVTIISGKFLGRNGGTTANAIKAVDYFTDLKNRGLNVVATNNSWGGGGYSQALYDAIERANAKGILFIAAAGNGGRDGVGDNNDVTPHYPSSYTNTNIIAVASITSSGAKSGFSNYGATSVDIAAPGSGINSTLPFNKYGSYSGTSMATPHVTGGAALYAATHPGATAAAIKSAIESSAVKTSAFASLWVTGGRLNVSGF